MIVIYGRTYGEQSYDADSIDQNGEHFIILKKDNKEVAWIQEDEVISIRLNVEPIKASYKKEKHNGRR